MCGIAGIFKIDKQPVLRQEIKLMTDAIAHRGPDGEGDFIDEATGKVVGKHEGSWFYTIGQRKGLKIGGTALPYYVSGKDNENNNHDGNIFLGVALFNIIYNMYAIGSIYIQNLHKIKNFEILNKKVTSF